jgi:hypothetical protein
MNLNIKLRPIQRQLFEIQMGHCSCGYTIPGVDCVSATANADGFTPLTSLMRVYPWNRDFIVEACEECNQKGVPMLFENLSPRLVLVPQSKGELNPNLTRAYAKCLFEGNVRNLHFSHYGFVQNRLALSEIDEILAAIEGEHEKANEITLYVDIDSRSEKEIERFLAKRSRNMQASY